MRPQPGARGRTLFNQAAASGKRAARASFFRPRRQNRPLQRSSCVVYHALCSGWLNEARGSRPAHCKIWCAELENRSTDRAPPSSPSQIKLADQILAEDKHAPMFKVRFDVG
jgi:hypothetical protein